MVARNAWHLLLFALLAAGIAGEAWLLCQSPPPPVQGQPLPSVQAIAGAAGQAAAPALSLAAISLGALFALALVVYYILARKREKAK